MPRPPGAPRFAGFQAPRYTPIPDALFDELLPDLSGAELKVLLYILRRTLGFKKEADAISLSQICHGILTRSGQRLDRGTGLSRGTASSAIRTLEGWGLIAGTRRRGPTGSPEPTTYQPHFAADPGTIFVPGWSENRTTPGSLIRPAPVRKADPQETVEQDTAKQETDTFESVSLQERAPAAGEAEAISIIRRVITDFACEFNDLAHERSNVTRAVNLWRRSGLPVDDFVTYAYDARRLTREYQGKQPPGKRIEAKGAYFFAVLEDIVARVAGQPKAPTDRAPPATRHRQFEPPRSARGER